MHSVHREHEWGEGPVPGKAERAVLVLLLLLVSLEDFLRGSIAIRRGVRVSDTDIEDRRSASSPEPVDSNVASEFWSGLGAVGTRRSHVLTGLDEGFVRDSGGGVCLAAKMSSRCHEVVVAVEDQPPFATGHGVLRSEAFATSVASGREGGGCQA